MAALLNELIEEAVGRCQQLSVDTAEVGEAVDSIGQKAGDLAARVAQEGEELHGQFQQLAQKAK